MRLQPFKGWWTLFFRNYRIPILFVYLDDIVLYTNSFREYEIKFNKLDVSAAPISNFNRINAKLCKEITYFGHIIEENGVKSDPKKIEAVKKFPQPTNAKNLKQFLDLARYYRRFVPNFSKTIKPLTDLLKKEAVYSWTNTQTKTFEHLRNALYSQPLLQYPDFTKFVITTNASKIAIGGIGGLSQGLKRYTEILCLAFFKRRIKLLYNWERAISNCLLRKLSLSISLRT